MQTNQLTTLLESTSGFTNPVGVTDPGTGQGSFDFGALLLSLLSMESPPVELAVPVGEEPETTGQPTTDGENNDSADSLKTAASVGKQTAASVKTVAGFRVDTQTALLAEQAGKATEGLINPSVGSPLLNTQDRQFAALTDIAKPSEGLLPVQSEKGTADIDKSFGRDAGKTPLITGPGESVVPRTEYTPSVNQPVIVDLKNGGIEVLDYRVELPEQPGVEITIPAGSPSPLIDENIADEYTIKRDILSAGPRQVPAERPTFNTGFAVTEQKPSFIKAATIPVIPAVKQSFGPATSTPIPATSTPIPATSTPVTLSVDTQSAAIAPVIVASNAQAGVSAKEIAALFPNAEIEMLKVPAKKRETAGTDLMNGTRAKAKPRPPVLFDQTNHPTAATVARKSPEGPDSIIRLSQDSSGQEHITSPRKTITIANGPELPGGMKIKSQAVRMHVETEIKPVTTPPNADVTGATKTDTATTRSENLSRTQFILEPETFRSPAKLPAEIRLRLVPESLGVLKLTLRAVANHLTARVIVQSAAARMAVEGNLAELQRTLADAGLVIDRFTVTVGHTAGASPTHPDTDSQRRRYAYKPKTNRRYQAAAGIKQSTPVADAPPTTAAMPMGQYTLNMVA